MADYRPPQAEIEQVLENIPSVSGRLLKACLVGGHAQLVRYSNPDEKEEGLLGEYDPLTEEAYEWPNKEVGAIVDLDYVRLFADNALLKYHEDSVGSGSLVNKVAGHSNRIRAASTNFKANGTTYPRAASLLRDVQPGDVAYIRGTESGDDYELTANVIGVIGDTVAAVVGAASADAGNGATNAGDTTATKTAGPDNCISNPANWTIDHSNYDGLADGNIVETYTIRVTQSSTGGNHTTARLRITSASGNDDVDNVAPAALGNPTNIGTRGLTAAIDEPVDTTACEAAAVLAGVSANDLLEGMEWTIEVEQVFDAPVPTSAGTYSGTSDASYILTVVKGGDASAAAGSRPRIMVTTTNASDTSGPTELVEDSGDPGTTLAALVGTKGVTVAFDQILFNKGDRYYIPVTAAKEGAMKTLVLSKSIPSAIQTSTDLHLKLYIRKSGLEIARERFGSAPLVNYEKTTTELTVKDGITVLVDEWSSGGVPQPLPLEGGKLYAHYRAWKQDLVGSVWGFQNASSINSAISGANSPDNPLKYAAFKCAVAAGGVEVRFAVVSNPSDVDSWVDAIEVLGKDSEAYGMVPLTKDKAVLDLFEAHVNGFSTPETNLWRFLWVSGKAYASKVIVDASLTDDEEEAVATIADNPQASGTQYTLVTVSENNVDLLEAGVRPKDVYRTNYVNDGFGNITYDQFEIERVNSSDELVLATANSVAVSVAQKFEIHRNLNPNEEAAEIGNTEGFTNRRVAYVLPDRVGSGGQMVDGYFLCATLAGLRASSYPHEPLTRKPVPGWDDLSRANRFNRDQLDLMAGNGVWIVYRDQRSGTILTRHAVTTAPNELILEREESVTTNVDQLSYELYDFADGYIGRANVNQLFIDLLGTNIREWVQNKQDVSPNDRLGPQLLENSSLIRIGQHVTEKDMIFVDIDAEVPVGVNRIRVRLGVAVATVATVEG